MSNKTYMFSVEDAEKYGVDEAIMLQNIRFWSATNEANGRHFIDGRYWTYNSVKAFVALFPFWSVNAIRRILKNLEDRGAIVAGFHSKNTHDRTKWYALSDECICGNPQIESLESTNESNKQIENTDKKQRAEDFEKFWESYPKKEARKAAETKWMSEANTKARPNTDQLIQILETHKQQKQWTKDNGDFIPRASTWLNQERWNDIIKQTSPARTIAVGAAPIV